jgi:peroxiredoxin
MKKLLCTIVLITVGCLAVFSQGADTTTKETVHVSVYLDEHGEKIDEKKFFELVQTAQYSFHSKTENGKVIAMQLEKKANALQVGSSAPDFTVMDLNGKEYKLSDWNGKIVVLNFWFTECVPCIQEMPELNKVAEKYKDNAGIAFLSITYDSEEKVRNFLAKHDFHYPVAAGQKALTDQYGIAGYPTNMVLDKTGKVTLLLAAYSTENVSKLDKKIRSMAKQ